MHVLIVGCGRVGAQLASELVVEGHRVSIIDPNPHSIYRLNFDFTGKFVVGNGIDEDVLKKSGIEEADVLVATTDKDNTNVMVAQIAKELYQVPRVVARVNDPASNETFNLLGIEKACLTSVCANYLKQAIL